jgi:purine-nucleoside/S-methyl-5'-thioadenosine phosphorylase / adenosine deaminase
VKLPGRFKPRGEHIEIELPGARALFTTRRGGHSSGPYESLNLGRLTDDDPECVKRNRAAVQADIGMPLTLVRQVHGKHVLTVSGPNEPPLPAADGQATASRAVAPAVLTADCLPIALAADGAVAMVHAGWRGLAAGVIDEGVAALRELGGRGPISAAIGPGAGPCCYEVGEEVLSAFDEPGPHLDLKSIARARLEHAGVAEVHDVGLCTICSPPGLFFSHRRDRGVTGRQAGIAWLT